MARKCGQLIADIPANTDPGRHPLAFAMLNWVAGYITAENFALEDRGERGFNMSSLTVYEMWASIYGHCSRNPDDMGAVAAIEVMTKMERAAFP